MYIKEELIKPFYFDGGKVGIVLIHGFTACPIDMKPLGEALNTYGYTIAAPLLAGHGLTPEELKNTSWYDWVDSASEAVKALRERCEKVIAVGHSMGGLIALSLAAESKLDGVVSINSPIIYSDRNFHFADRLLGKQEYLDKENKQTEISVNREGLPHYSYIKVPVNSFVSFNKAITPVQNELGKIECPALVVQSLEDKMVDPKSGRMIEKSIKHRHKDVIYWAKEDHYIILSAQRNKLADKIQVFLMKNKLSN